MRSDRASHVPATGAAGALVFRFDVDAQALAAVQLEALTADGQRLTAWPSSSSTREAKRLTHGRFLRGASWTPARRSMGQSTRSTALGTALASPKTFC